MAGTTFGMDGETRPVDYAAINAVWVSLAAALVASTRKRGSEDPITNQELIPLAAATFPVSKAGARERIGIWVPEPFVDQAEGQRPKGDRIQRAVGELVTCTRCAGPWSALGVVGLRVLPPQAGMTVGMVLVSLAANAWVQAGFKLLTEQTTRVGTRLPPTD